jgi:hypothetical protein
MPPCTVPAKRAAPRGASDKICASQSFGREGDQDGLGRARRLGGPDGRPVACSLATRQPGATRYPRARGSVRASERGRRGFTQPRRIWASWPALSPARE